MSTGYFSSDSRVLLADGSYKSISNVQIGDHVLNMESKPVKVTDVIKGEKKMMHEVRYQNWYAPLYCNGDLKIRVQKEDSSSEWVTASELSNEHRHVFDKNLYLNTFPATFTVTVKGKELGPSNELGLLFGLYAGYGSIGEKDGASELVFRFGPNETLLTQVSDLFTSLFDVETTTHKDEYCYQVRTGDDQIVQFFREFGSKMERTVPKRYLATEENFVQGLFQGLIDYDPNNKLSRFIPVSRGMAEVFVFVCTLLDLSFSNDTPRIDKTNVNVYPLMVSDEQEAGPLAKFYQSVLVDVELDTWALKVDSPDNSFIVNNLIVQC